MQLTNQNSEWEFLGEDTRKCLADDADRIKSLLLASKRYEQQAQNYLANLQLNNDQMLGIWTLFDSAERSALKRR